MNLFNNNTIFWKLLPFGLLYLVYLIGQFLDILDVDACQYAAISWEMQMTNDWLEVKQRGGDYLDKPPLLFWVSAFMFKIFGTSNFVYRIIPVLSSLAGAYCTYKLAKLYYSEQVAYLAALFLASCQAVFLMNHDVRTDTMLTASVAFTTWQLAAYFQSHKPHHLFWGFAGVGLAMLAKGPIGLMIPIFTFSLDFAIKRQWGNFFQWRYLLGLALVALILLPMCIGLYQQFDLHPEKEAYGEKGISGLRFYFWTQSFGRITGENVWSNNPDPFFLVHSTLWSFLPWSFLLIIAYINETIRVFRNGFKKLSPDQEIFLWAGYTISFLALSRSSYQLPHYIYLVYPLGAIITAKWVPDFINFSKTAWAWVNGFQIFLVLALITLIGVLGIYCFSITSLGAWAGALVLFIGAIFYVFKAQNRLQSLVMPLFFTILGVNFFLNAAIYPTLFQYQTETVVGRMVYQNKEIGENQFYSMGVFVFSSLDFYSQRIVPHVKEINEIRQKGPIWIYADAPSYEQKIKKSEAKVLDVKEFADFHVSTLSPEFLNPYSRAKVVNKMYLVKLEMIAP
jgi:hypothetical protein